MMESAINTLISVDEQSKHKEKVFDLGSKHLMEVLENTSEVLQKAPRGQLEHVFASLTGHPPNAYFFTWLYMLEAESNLKEVDLGAFLKRVQLFVTVCDKDYVKYAPGKFSSLLKNFTARLIAADRAAIGIRILKVALNKLAITPDHLTPAHALLAQICLVSKNYQAAVQTLDRDVTEIDPAKTDVQPVDALSYFYYGGMIYIGLKQFKRARDLFALAISSPAQVLSAIVVESYKKFVLVSLLIDGQVGALPKYTSNSVQRQLKTLTPSYADFAKTYQSHKQPALQDSYQKHLLEFEKDHNAGLAAQVVQSLYRRNILRLTQTYVTLSLADIATSVQLPGPKDAEKYILRMIEEGEIHASINQKDSMVSFRNNPEQYDNTSTLTHLDAQIRNAAIIGNRVDDLHKKIASSHQYLMKIHQSEKGVPFVFEDPEFEVTGERHQGGVQVQ